jgi:hydrogenase maturation protease
VTRKCLLIGFGNTIRRDDGLGPLVVESLAEEQLKGMVVLKITIPQIDLILARDLSVVDIAVFVDARADDVDDIIKVERCGLPDKKPTPSFSSHELSIQGLLSLTFNLYGRAPDAYIITPKGYDFSIGEGLSPGAEVAASKSIDAIINLLTSTDQPAPVANLTPRSDPHVEESICYSHSSQGTGPPLAMTK